ncbi:DNA polymerase delta subunit 3 [Oryzias melastigma]|uniref:DNA polymerase delta subunit 3 n=1 Tax=Oryzias melastigma TaxID=30732 RepID=A0A834BUR2_ORYME|nr:DNA polymerase delta subunit 3 [Oryzias melastigma]
MDELYLDNIDEFVNDHNKIVTYKSLSLALGVHVNTAKQMLYHYLEHKRKESSPQLHATYLVTGKFVGNGQTRAESSAKDSGPLYSVDYDAVKDNLKNCSKYSAIRCAGAEPMSPLELQQTLKVQIHPQPEPESSGTNRGTNTTSKSNTKPQKGIMGMFSNKPAVKNTSNEVKPEQKEDTAVVDAAKNKPAAKANPVMNFFGSQAAKKSVKPVKEETDQTSSTSEPPQRQSPQPCEKQDSAAAVQHQKDSRSKTKRVEDADSEEEKMDKKKRRRIKRPDPDSSDEDVTEKGFVSESYSESEDDFQASKPAQRESSKAKPNLSSKDDDKKSQKKAPANSNKGAKQASIVGFFQKK